MGVAIELDPRPGRTASTPPHAPNSVIRRHSRSAVCAARRRARCTDAILRVALLGHGSRGPGSATQSRRLDRAPCSKLAFHPAPPSRRRVLTAALIVIPILLLVAAVIPASTPPGLVMVIDFVDRHRTVTGAVQHGDLAAGIGLGQRLGKAAARRCPAARVGIGALPRDKGAVQLAWACTAPVSRAATLAAAAMIKVGRIGVLPR